MSKSSKQILKPLGYRLTELIDSLLVVRDSLNLIKRGASRQLIPLYG